MSEVEIRPTIPADLDILAHVLLRVHAVDGYPVEGVERPREWVDLPSPLGQWTAVLEGTPVGHVAVMPAKPDDGAPPILQQLDGVPLARIATLVRLFVDPSARRKSIAAQLVHAAEARQKDLGMSLVLDVMEKDFAAIAMYESLGWRRLGSVQHDGGASQPTPALAYVAPSSS